MFQFQQPFDARIIDPSQFAQIPLADYKVVIVDSEPKENSNKDGGFIECTVKIIEGQFKDLDVPYRLHIFNKSEAAVKIAYKQLSALAHVTGNIAGPLQNTGQLHNIPFIATIGPQKTNSDYNEVKLVKDINGNVPGKAAANPVATSPAAPSFAPPAAQPQQFAPPSFQPPAVAQPAAATPWATTQAAPAPTAQPVAAPWQQNPAPAAVDNRPPWMK